MELEEDTGQEALRLIVVPRAPAAALLEEGVQVDDVPGRGRAHVGLAHHVAADAYLAVGLEVRHLGQALKRGRRRQTPTSAHGDRVAHEHLIIGGNLETAIHEPGDTDLVVVELEDLALRDHGGNIAGHAQRRQLLT